MSKAAAWPAFYVAAYFAVAAVVAGRLGGAAATSFFLLAIGVCVAAGFLIHARATPRRKGLGRRLSLALVGPALLLGAGVFGRQSFQIEGFFFYTLGGVAGGVVVHYLVAKILGPVFIGRAWCAWGCWIWMVFDYLPWKRSPGRRRLLGWIREAHFATSLSLVVGLVVFARYDHGFTWQSTDGLWWFLGGCLVYYAVGVGFAATFRDNRAFCKYLCPVSVFLRLGSRLSLLRIVGSPDACTQCGACERICPMDVSVREFVAARLPVSDSECTLCQRCVAVCNGQHLHVSLVVPFGGRRLAARRPEPVRPRSSGPGNADAPSAVTCGAMRVVGRESPC